MTSEASPEKTTLPFCMQIALLHMVFNNGKSCDAKTNIEELLIISKTFSLLFLENSKSPVEKNSSINKIPGVFAIDDA